MRIALIVLSFCLGSLVTFGQNTMLLASLKDSIQLNSQLMVSSIDDSEKLIYSDRISKNVERFIKQEKSIDYNLDSLKLVKVITSKNKYLRIFTWVVPLNDGTYMFKGISQSYSHSSRSYRISILNDKGDKMSRVYNKQLNYQKWYGAYYYKLIQTKRGKKYFYTLLGWRGIDKTVQSKLVEVVTIRNNGDIVFGYNLFNIKGYEYFESTPSVKRLIYKYSSISKMYLSYDYQTIVIKTKKKHSKTKKKSKNIGFVAQKRINQPKEKVKNIKDYMIVIDRLEPTSSDVKGFYEFYYPESNIIDALRFENNIWKYYPDIDARNKANPADKKVKKIKYELTPQ